MGELLPFQRRRTTSDAGESARPEPVRREPLWRAAVGRELRSERQRQRRTLADVGGSAGVSVQYLSEVERGRKEPSSEVLQAISGALGLRLIDLTARVTRRLGSRAVSTRPTGPVALAA